MRAVHLVVPGGIDDPARPSGGNVYDRRLSEELTRSGWSVGEHPVSSTVSDTLAGVLAPLPDDSLVLVDGLVALDAPDDLLRHTSRLRVVVLLHMPFGERDASVRSCEGLVLSAATAVVTTSEWSRSWVVSHYGLAPERVQVARPGVDPAVIAEGTPTSGALLCVAAVTKDKGHRALLTALALVADLPWSLTCVGSLDRDPALVTRLQRRADDLELGDRISWTGALTGDDLDEAYADADVLVLPSHAESWGMVVSEALARGLPVLARDVGGVPEALGAAPDGGTPGVLVSGPTELSDALRQWLTDAGLRGSLRASARSRRTTLDGWSVTAESVARVLEEVSR